MSFRENLLHLRATHHMTQEQLAVLLGVSRQSVTKWESDKSYPEMDKLIKMCEIFDCTLDELVLKDLTDRAPASPDAADEGELAVLPTDVFGYDEHMRSFANRISSGIMVILLGTALSVIFYNLAEAEQLAFIPLAENVADAIGTMLVLAGVALGLLVIIPAGMNHAAFVRQHPRIDDFYTEEERAKTRSLFIYNLIGGIVLIFAATCIVILFSDTPLEGIVGVPLMMVLIAFGARSIVYGSIMLGRLNIGNYNEGAAEVLASQEIEQLDLTDEEKNRMKEHRTRDQKTGALCGSIMIIATIAGLVMLFVPEYQTPLFWLAWPIGGLLCGVAANLMKLAK